MKVVFLKLKSDLVRSSRTIKVSLKFRVMEMWREINLVLLIYIIYKEIFKNVVKSDFDNKIINFGACFVNLQVYFQGNILAFNSRISFLVYK